MAVDEPGVLGTRSSTVLASQLRAGGVVGAHTLPAHAITRELIRKEPCTHMDVGAWIVEIRFLDAVSSEPREVRTVDLHEADVVSAGALAMRVVDRSRIEPRFDPGHRIEELRRHAVALSRFLPARRSKTGCETQRKDGSCCNTSHGSPQTRNWRLTAPETFGRRGEKAATAVKVGRVSPGDEGRLRRGVLLGMSHRARALRYRTASIGGARRLLSAGALSGILTSLIEDAPLGIAGEPNECDASRRKLV